jgi:hypothetical protein
MDKALPASITWKTDTFVDQVTKFSFERRRSGDCDSVALIDLIGPNHAALARTPTRRTFAKLTSQ